MTDLISRKDAIEAIIECYKESDMPEDWHRGLYRGLNIIKALPSAPQWIPCSERLPSEDGRYLVTYPLLRCQDNWISVMHYGKPVDPTQDVKGKCFYYSDGEWGDVVYNNILAWMPLPEPWKGADDE